MSTTFRLGLEAPMYALLFFYEFSVYSCGSADRRFYTPVASYDYINSTFTEAPIGAFLGVPAS
jgi:hypothetical protein